MEKIDSNQNWTFSKYGQESATTVALPHDAMIYEERKAGCGIIDILGNPRPEIWLNKVVYGISDTPYIGVEPVDHAGENRLIGAWRYSDAVHSWSWDGCEGKKADIVVYSRAAKVKFFQDGQLVGEQALNQCQAKFETVYRPGILESIAYDKDGMEIGRGQLRTAKKHTKISLYPEKESLVANGQTCAT